MRVVQKHKFEAVSLLTTQSGFLDVTVVPVIGQPNWLIPTSLVLEVIEFKERIWNFLWNKQDVAIYHLLPKGETPNKIIILEGNTDVHRMGLQIKGNIHQLKLKISELKDTELPENFKDLMYNDEKMPPQMKDFGLSFVYQAVTLNDELFIVPAVDTISHKLVDLDSF